MTTDDVIAAIIQKEGSIYTNRPTDRGGPTKYGITQKTLAAARGHAVTPADVEALTEDEARTIYVKQFVFDPGFNAVTDDELRAALVDFGVNSGPARAIRWLQRSLNVDEPHVNGVLGPQTLSAITSVDGRLLLATLVAFRAYAAHRIEQEDHSQEGNQDGWLNRVFSFLPFNTGYHN